MKILKIFLIIIATIIIVGILLLRFWAGCDTPQEIWHQIIIIFRISIGYTLLATCYLLHYL